jgi:hypothetical protein
VKGTPESGKIRLVRARRAVCRGEPGQWCHGVGAPFSRMSTSTYPKLSTTHAQ